MVILYSLAGQTSLSLENKKLEGYEFRYHERPAGFESKSSSPTNKQESQYCVSESKMNTYNDALTCLRRGFLLFDKNRRDPACWKKLPKAEDLRGVECACGVWCFALSRES